MTYNSKRLWLFFLLTHAALIALFVTFRFVDWDEGFYLQAGRSVASGLRLYFDFFHPQAPIFPQLVSYLSDGSWAMLFEARTINAVLSALTMTLVALCAVRIYRIKSSNTSPVQITFDHLRWVMFSALFLYCFSGMFLSWNSAAKPLALSQFFLVAGLLLRLYAYERSALLTVITLFGSGVALAMAAQTRSPMLVALALMLVHVLLASDIRFKLAGSLAFLTGAHLAALPTLVSLAHDWQRFIYNNFGFHLSRTEIPSIQEIVYDKLWTAGKLLLDPQIALVLLLCIVILWRVRRHYRWYDWLRKPELFTGLLGVALFAVYLRAHPSLRQYFVQALPLIVVFVAANAPVVHEWITERFADSAKKVIRVGIVVYLLGLIPYSALYIVAPREYDRKGAQGRMHEIASLIQSASSATDRVLSESAIYPVLAQRTPLARTEFVGFQYHSLALGGNYGLMNLPDTNYLYREVSARTPALVITDFEPDRGLADRLEKNYELIFSDDYARVYRRVVDSLR
jgi:hypothetical protein